MTHEQSENTESRLRVLFKEMLTEVIGSRETRFREVTRAIGREPFARRTWSELSFLALGAPLAGVGLAFVAVTMSAGVVLAITFFGLAVMALSVRGARGFGGFHRNLARNLLGEEIEDPEPFAPRAGFFGWLQSALRDRTGWRAMAYLIVKAPLVAFGIFFGFAVWWDAFFCLIYPLRGWGNNSVPVFGVPQFIFGSNFFSGYQTGFWHGVGVFLIGGVLLFAAPWAVRAVVYVDRRVLRVLLAPDPMAARVRSLEQARTQTVDSSAATLRRIERDLHDGTQAQLVALAMRLGMAKEKLAEVQSGDGEGEGPDLAPGTTTGRRRPPRRQRSHHRATGSGPGHPPPRARYRVGGCTVHLGRSQHGPDLTHPLVELPTDAGHRGHRLLLRG